ncbi:secreted protein, putative [Ixodes scapularis]|uniref:Secreted protein, putative n=1 Tax=Ixodes scapularis TaxID=6945 RepID=B7P6Z0_IXOSC|nr:secreted protein, putative [Ixodes scapularis]|eukprot:XP_002409415.1 secreted protein, putative [Ixodes scapularis]
MSPSRRVMLCLVAALLTALMVQEASAGKLKKLAKYGLIGAALAPRIIPIPIAVGHHHAHVQHAHYDHGWQGWQGGHGGWW